MLTVAGLAAPAFATNGMNMEGYGPIATGMGGASSAYDNGTAGMINNPATLGLMKSGTSRFDVAIGGLHPNVDVRVQGMNSSASSGDAYYMPAIGYVRKDGNLTWGAGMFSQGGMGTEWGRTSVLSAGGITSGTINMGGFPPGTLPVNPPVPAGNATFFGAPALQPGTNLEQRSELGIGRFLIPVAYDFSPNFRVGGSIDYVWGGLDMMAVIDGNTFANMAFNANNANKRAVGYINSNSSMMASLAPVFTAGGIDYAHISFSEGTNKFKQELTTSGWGGNIGFQWQASKELAIGAVYHARTSLDDMSGGATMTIQCSAGNAACIGGFGGLTVPMRGTMRVINFQWPETIGVGMSWQPTDKWQIVADYKNIMWSNVMQQFHMRFTSGGQFMDFGLNQNWDDQNVFQIGVAYKMDDALTLRAGANLANNPIPAGNTNPLFPATVENHYTLGAGYALSKSSALDFSLSIAPEVSVTTPGTPIANGFAAGNPLRGMTAGPSFSTSHSQTNWQLMYSNKF